MPVLLQSSNDAVLKLKHRAYKRAQGDSSHLVKTKGITEHLCEASVSVSALLQRARGRLGDSGNTAAPNPDDAILPESILAARAAAQASVRDTYASASLAGVARGKDDCRQPAERVIDFVRHEIVIEHLKDTKQSDWLAKFDRQEANVEWSGDLDPNLLSQIPTQISSETRVSLLLRQMQNTCTTEPAKQSTLAETSKTRSFSASARRALRAAQHEEAVRKVGVWGGHKNDLLLSLVCDKSVLV